MIFDDDHGTPLLPLLFLDFHWRKEIGALRDDSAEILKLAGLNLPGSELVFDLYLANGPPVTTYGFDSETNDTLAHTEHTRDG